MSFDQLACDPMLILPERTEPAMHAAYHALCRSVGASPRIELELDALDAVLAFAAAGLGFSLAPSSVARFRMPGVVYVPLSPEIPSGVTAVWDPGGLGPAAAAMLEEVLVDAAR